MNETWNAKVLITTRVGRYIWEPAFQVVDFIPKGKKKAEFTIYLREPDNTELRATIRATQDMLTKLKESLKERTDV